MSNPQVILHWYPSSPFCQKVIWALQYKKVDFKLVLISPIEPRPLRRPLDGGYRRTPVLQIGNHTYCDTKLIFDELEARFPEPSFYPVGPDGKTTKAQIKGLARWTDGPLFMSIVSQIPWEVVGEVFVQDRSKFIGNSINIEQAKLARPYMVQAVQSEIKLIDAFICEHHEDGKLWALGTQTLSLLDLHFAMATWFSKNFVGDAWFNSTVPTLTAHLDKVLATVHYADLDKIKTIEPKEALKIAKEESWTLTNSIHDGSLNIELGQLVHVSPTDSGLMPAKGALVHSTECETVIEHQEEEYNFTSYTHFPVIGFVVLPQTSKL
ncbi:uncharacterized protein BX663DRAFT_508569 [Cokeromyces recurvatus]|uniref:uncharacterized protein n=1 Tax=Cokeromyces recurvatus TaxID=90255 RepID=UPI00221F7106|nr:uncharacterized protein BX663DRAFT_508569 [Cokeromyces recurvatus]KAI7902829.1 hypothetical protein BX663DRAFT_508569 [Cokeromyces recurvatus]